MRTLLAAFLSLPLIAAAQSFTCVSPGPCVSDLTIVHLKRIHCEWTDGLIIDAEVPFGVIPLAGENGVSQPQQCEHLRQAVQ